MRRVVIIIFIVVKVFVLISNVFAGEGDKRKRQFSFGVIADCQYSFEQNNGIRKYALSKSKLKKAITHFNTMELKFVVHLGDFINNEYKNIYELTPMLDELNFPLYHVLGNHDFSVGDADKKKIPKTLGMKSKYYDFNVGKWRFVVLDGNDLSFYAYPKNSEMYNLSKTYYNQNMIEYPEWNGGISKKQISWLKTVLEKASKLKEKVIMFCHFPIFPENVHNLWNSKEIEEIIKEYTCVKAYINGHNHHGNYSEKDGIHYLTIKGMVDTEQTSYAIIKVDDEQLEVIGYGREESRIMIHRDK